MVAEVQSDMPPRPRPGPLGLWDLLVGPGATSGENTLIVAASLLGAAAAAARLAEHGASGWLIAIGAALGLDIIGDRLTEINVTSPTCIREIEAAFDVHITGMLMDAIERRLGK